MGNIGFWPVCAIRRSAIFDPVSAARMKCGPLCDGETRGLAIARTVVGITDASTTRKPETPTTRSHGSTTAFASPPRRQVPTG